MIVRDEPFWSKVALTPLIGVAEDFGHPVFANARETLPGPDEATDDGRISVCVTAFLQNVFNGFFIWDLVMKVVEGPLEGNHEPANAIFVFRRAWKVIIFDNIIKL
jgi:hypothetical protein